MERKKSKKIAASKNSPLKTLTTTNNGNNDSDERLYFSWENYLFFIYGKILLEGKSCIFVIIDVINYDLLSV
jgi:hypothetical protein